MYESWRHPARQLQADSSQIVRCQLQILSSRLRRCMPQYVTDDLERHAGSQQTHGTCMAKGVGPVFALRSDSGGAEAGSRHAVEDRAGFERTMRREDTDEDFSIRARGTRVLQVSEQRLPRL